MRRSELAIRIVLAIMAVVGIYVIAMAETPPGAHVFLVTTYSGLVATWPWVDKDHQGGLLE